MTKMTPANPLNPHPPRVLYTRVGLRAGPCGPKCMLPTVPTTPHACTDTKYTLTYAPDDVSGMRALHTHVKMDPRETVHREHDTTRRSMLSPGRETPRNLAHVPTAHRTHSPTSVIAGRPTWTCSCTRTRRAASRVLESSLPPQGAREGARAAAQKRAAHRQHPPQPRGTRAGQPARLGERCWPRRTAEAHARAHLFFGHAAEPTRAREPRKLFRGPPQAPTASCRERGGGRASQSRRTQWHSSHGLLPGNYPFVSRGRCLMQQVH